MKITLEYAKENIVDGILIAELDSWMEFNEYVCSTVLNYKHYIWRGQRNADWQLESTLNRTLRDSNGNKEDLINMHLERFKYATRGRRGTTPVKIESEDDWWALGQHHGIATPLLDWTTSPFVAAYFAFYEENKNGSAKRAVFSLHSSEYIIKSNEILKNNPDKSNEIIKIIKPYSDENPRLVNQSGLFTKIPIGTDIEKWTKENFNDKKFKIRLLKIILPESERNTILKALNRMNINHLTLFPDLTGVSMYANMSLNIDNY